VSRPTTPAAPAPRRRPARPVLVGAVALTGVLALSSCSVSSPDLSTGTAAEVGSTSISLSEVDTVASAVCSNLDDAADQPVAAGQTAPQPFPGAEVRTSILEGLVLRALGDQLREDLDVSPSSDYGDQVAQARTFFASAPGPVDDVVPAVTGASYYSDLVIQVGRIRLGLDDVSPQDAQRAFAAGLPVVQSRIGDTPITTNPLFPELTLSDNPVQGGQLVFFERDASAQSLSVAVSDQAVGAQGDGAQVQADPQRLTELPDSQVCG